MKTSTEIGSITKIIGEEKAVELVAKAGFDAWDFSMFNTMWRWGWTEKREIIVPHPLNGENYLAFARKLKQIGLDNGIVCNQSHAPFPSRLCGEHICCALSNVRRRQEGIFALFTPTTIFRRKKMRKCTVDFYLLPSNTA